MKRQQLSGQISPASRRLLELVKSLRYVTSEQLATLLELDYSSYRSSLRQIQRRLASLQDCGLVVCLQRRIGGWQGGSSGAIWAITTKGSRFLTGKTRRVRPRDVSLTFLQHQLAVSEARIRIAVAARILGVNSKIQVDTEPECWRSHLNQYGVTTILKPDLFASVETAEYVDNYFLEVDLGTETPARIVRKCFAYQDYRATGIEQAKLGGFPAVIWVTSNEKRKEQLAARISSEPRVTPGLFHVITIDELTALIRDGPG